MEVYESKVNKSGRYFAIAFFLRKMYFFVKESGSEHIYQVTAPTHGKGITLDNTTPSKPNTSFDIFEQQQSHRTTQGKKMSTTDQKHAAVVQYFGSGQLFLIFLSKQQCDWSLIQLVEKSYSLLSPPVPHLYIEARL